MMAAVNGTIPRGFEAFHYEATDEDAERAGRELKDPFPTTKEILKEGEELYASYCLICHGEIGKGDGPLIPTFRNPPSYSSATVAKYPAGRIYHTIVVGKNTMASYAVQLSVKERWYVTKYVQTLQKAK
jgi:mono/diheme cytochrome c family protein